MHSARSDRNLPSLYIFDETTAQIIISGLVKQWIVSSTVPFQTTV